MIGHRSTVNHFRRRSRTKRERERVYYVRLRPASSYVLCVAYHQRDQRTSSAAHGIIGRRQSVLRRKNVSVTMIHRKLQFTADD